MNHQMKKRILFIGILLSLVVIVSAQQYTGMTGLIHSPSADMNEKGNAQVGIHFMNKHFVPEDVFTYNGERYNTSTHYLNITPYSWIELGYTCTLMKGSKDGKTGFYHKDRYFSIKIRPLKEDKWWPSIAVGSNDPITTSKNKDNENVVEEKRNMIFCNYYMAVTKHFNISNSSLGVHLAYRHWKRSYNSKWNGMVGGITFRPAFASNLRVIAEYDGDGVNTGIDGLLWKHLFLQVSLQKGKFLSGGICFQINLF